MNHANYELIQTIEELSLNAWAPLQQILYDGWVLRFANGYTRRANSINPIYPGRKDLHKKIRYCEKRYLSKNLTPVFRLTPLANADILDEILEQSGYLKQDYVSVQIKDLTCSDTTRSNAVHFSHSVNFGWFDSFCRLANVAEDDRHSLLKILNNIVSETCFAMLLKDNEVVSCGLGVLESNHIGLFELVTAQHQRRKGFSYELISSILDWAKMHNAKTAYLQVVMDNYPANRLYSKLGFKELYQYFYRVKSASS